MFEGKRISEKVGCHFGLADEGALYCFPFRCPCTYLYDPIHERFWALQIDVFSFGILLWEMLTGQLPWGELSSPMQARHSVALSWARFHLLLLPGPAALQQHFHGTL